MPAFQCRAMGADGETVSIQIEADSQETAAAEARIWASGMTLIAVEEVEASGGLLGDLSLGRLLPIGTKDKIMLFRMMGTLVRSGVTVTETIRIVHEQTEKQNLKAMLGDIRTRIEGGSPISDALAQHSRVFSPVMVSLIRAGEMGGLLETVFFRIADFLQRRVELRQKMFMAFFYPGLVLVVGIAVVIFMVVFVIPSFITLIRGNLPPITQFLMDVVDFVNEQGMTMVTGAGIGIGVFMLAYSLPFTRYFIDRYKINLPLIGSAIRLGIVASFARTFSVLLDSRIPMVEALRATNDTLSNTAVNRLLDEIVERVVSGEPFSSALRDNWVFTPMTRSMANIGEYSGLMSEAMDTVADIHEEMLSFKIARLSAMVEPALIVTLGLLVGVVVYALISGMLAMYSGAM